MYKELYESTKRELDDLESRMSKQTMTVASIATYPAKIDDIEFGNLKRGFYERAGTAHIRLDYISENSISIIGPNGAIGVADEFFREKGWHIEYADLIVLRRQK